MKNKNDRPEQTAELRKQAEAIAREKAAQSSENLETLSPEETRWTLHELEVHQIELEMQNEELRTAQLALEESRSRYADLYDFAPVGYFTISRNGRITVANLTGAALLGVGRPELIHHGFGRFVAPEEINRWDRHRLDALQQEGTVSCELTLKREDGSTFYARLDSIRTVADDGAFALRTTVADISERKQLEERIRQVRSDLLFAVSHDLKTPLQALNQSQEMLSALEPAEALARFQEYRQIWRRNLQRLERMINNLVDSQRGEEDRFPLLLAPCDPAEIVTRVVEDSQGYVQANQVTLDLKLEPVPEGSCDEEAIARVVENLLTNAVKFSPKGGHVEVCLRMEDQALLLEVEDHGLGIPANEQDQLFQPFQRSRSAQQKGIPGTGLGLYVCRRIVEEHGGTIALESELGKGTKVIVRLPWKKGAE